MATRNGTEQDAPNWLVWAALWTVYIVWGSTYLAIRVTVETLPPLLSGGVRFLIAGLIVLVVIRIKRGRDAIRISRPELLSSIVIGGGLLLGGNGLVVLAERTVSSSLAALLIATVPLWVILLRFLSGDRVAGGTLIGVAVGFIGVAILILPGDRPEGATLYGLGTCILAALIWAISSFMSPRVQLPRDPFLSTGVQMLCGSAWLFLFGFVGGEASGIDVGSFSGRSLFALGYLVLFGSLFGFTAYVWLLQNAPISKVSTYAYVNPVIALVLGWLILSEEMNPSMLIGAFVIVASVAFIVTLEGRAKRIQAAADGAPALAAEST
jgi:drug/metabolite transporter (DMT)-like permease